MVNLKGRPGRPEGRSPGFYWYKENKVIPWEICEVLEDGSIYALSYDSPLKELDAEGWTWGPRIPLPRGMR